MTIDDRTRTRRASHTTATLLALAVSALLLAPGAAATGYLVNVEVDPVASAKAGTNPLGGQGDTLDVGVFNHQCSDEDDVVDVGVANQEGTARDEPFSEDGYECTDPDGDCQTEEGGGVEGTLFGYPLPFRELFEQLPSLDDTTQPGTWRLVVIDSADGQDNSACTDDGDAVDVGVLNEEGKYDGEQIQWWHCSQTDDEETFEESNDSSPERDERGDRGDGVDAGVANWECNDQDDADDVGALNCEIRDGDDGIDVGAANAEHVDDSNDTLDLSVLAYEANDAPDNNGLDVLPANTPLGYCEHAGSFIPLPGSPGDLSELFGPISR